MEKAAADYEACMDDDFNTAGAVAAYFQLVTEANKYLEQAVGAVDEDAARVCAAVITGALVQLGVELPVIEEPLPVGLLGVAAGLTGYTGDDIDEAAEKILEARAAARAAKDWGTADAIRDQLRDMGLAIEDTAAGSRIKNVSSPALNLGTGTKLRHRYPAFAPSGFFGVWCLRTSTLQKGADAPKGGRSHFEVRAGLRANLDCVAFPNRRCFAARAARAAVQCDNGAD